MTQTRPPQRGEPAVPTPDRLVLRPPPRQPSSEGSSGLLAAVPMLGSLGSVLLVTSVGGEHRARALVAAALILVGTLGFVAVQVERQHRQRSRRVAGTRAAYRRHLSAVRGAAREAAAAQRRALTARHPDPRALPLLASRSRRCARRRLWRFHCEPRRPL